MGQAQALGNGYYVCGAWYLKLEVRLTVDRL
jgi:hypothetical protein